MKWLHIQKLLSDGNTDCKRLELSKVNEYNFRSIENPKWRVWNAYQLPSQGKLSNT